MPLNKKYIEQLAKGEIALDNSVRNLELLRRILKEAFPKSVTAAGNDNYYYKFGSRWSSSLNKAYIKDLPTIKLEDFLIKELPKDNFGIIIKNNGTEVIKYLIELGYNNYYNFHGNISNGAAYRIINNKIEAWCEEKIKKSNIQLFTLEEIKQLEQNMENTQNKKILGYIAPFDMCNGKVKKGDLFIKTFAGDSYRHDSLQGNTIPKEIVETWEKKFEDNILPQINGYSGKLEGDYIIYGSNCAKFHKNFFKQLKSINQDTQVNQVNNRYIKSIELTSGVKITMEQIEQIVKYIDNQ